MERSILSCAATPQGGGGAEIDLLKEQFVSLFLLLEELAGFVRQGAHHRGGRLHAVLCHTAGERAMLAIMPWSWADELVRFVSPQPRKRLQPMRRDATGKTTRNYRQPGLRRRPVTGRNCGDGEDFNSVTAFMM